MDGMEAIDAILCKSEGILNGKKLSCDCLKEKNNPSQEKNIDYS